MFYAYLRGYARHARISWSVLRPTHRAAQRQHPEVPTRHLSMPWAPPTYPFHSILFGSQRTKPAERFERPVGEGRVLGRRPGAVNDLQRDGRKNLWIVKPDDHSSEFPKPARRRGMQFSTNAMRLAAMRKAHGFWEEMCDVHELGLPKVARHRAVVTIRVDQGTTSSGTGHPYRHKMQSPPGLG